MDLKELVLDRNKIKDVGQYSFLGQSNLQELHIEENRLRELTNLGYLENLHRLFLGVNRIQVGGLRSRQDKYKCTVKSLLGDNIDQDQFFSRWLYQDIHVCLVMSVHC